MKIFGLGLGMLLLATALGSAPALSAGTDQGNASDGQSVMFDTALTPQEHGAGEYDGVLHLTFGPHGIINGWYRSVDAGQPHSIVGGLDGDKLWLDLGRSGTPPIEGTYDGGKIVGSTYFGNQDYSFLATPTKRS